jgi:hypothetical protein
MFVEVINTGKQVLGPTHPDILVFKARLVSTYMKQGQWKESEEPATEVLEMRKEVLGPNHPETLHSMQLLSLTRRKHV